MHTPGTCVCILLLGKNAQIKRVVIDEFARSWTSASSGKIVQVFLIRKLIGELCDKHIFVEKESNVLTP